MGMLLSRAMAGAEAASATIKAVAEKNAENFEVIFSLLCWLACLNLILCLLI